MMSFYINVDVLDRFEDVLTWQINYNKNKEN